MILFRSYGLIKSFLAVVPFTAVDRRPVRAPRPRPCHQRQHGKPNRGVTRDGTAHARPHCVSRIAVLTEGRLQTSSIMLDSQVCNACGYIRKHSHFARIYGLSTFAGAIVKRRWSHKMQGNNISPVSKG